jgi:hypothetical protein
MADLGSATGAPKPNPENEDPLFARILEAADLIRYIAQNAECYPTDAFSAVTWSQMLLEIADEADKIIRACGITNLEAHYEDQWGKIGEERNWQRVDYRPYEGVASEAVPENVAAVDLTHSQKLQFRAHLDVIENIGRLVKARFKATDDSTLKIASSQIADNVAGIRGLLHEVERSNG